MTTSKSIIRAVTIFSTQGPRQASENHLFVEEEKGIVVVADGFGGPLPGLQASKAACEAVRGFLIKEAGDQDATLPFELRSYFSLTGNVLFNSLIHANKKLVALNKGKNVHEKGGASVLAGYLDEGLLALANVGCCTAWLIRENGAVELTQPRSYGRLHDPFAREVPVDKRAPLMALGIHKDLEPEISEYRVLDGDWLLLHTEGMPAEVRGNIFRVRQDLGAKEGARRVLEQLEKGVYDTDLSASLIIL